MISFQNARIAVLEARMSGEMADLIRRNGGTAWSVPAVREISLNASQPVNNFLDQLVAGSMTLVVFFTGVGIKTLLQEADGLGRRAELVDVLRKIPVVCRGPKPSAVLRRENIPIAASAPEPYTTHELIEVLAPFAVDGKTVGVLHYGERNALIAETLTARGAYVEELCLYEWLLPERIDDLQLLVQDLVAGHVDAVVFTSQIQIRHLFLIAQELQLASDLVVALNTRTIVASIGPTCTGVLLEYGVTPHVIPEHPKMGYLIKALAEYMHS
jgi:uroporphyrinogen-III synthase